MTEFQNGYWYATQLKRFAAAIGIPSAGKLRKDELERAIEHVLRTGKIGPSILRSPASTGIKDVARGLGVVLRVVVYTNDAETKEFLEREATRIWPSHKRRPGARYRLNRWREAQLAAGVPLTYGDLAKEYARLCRAKGRFAQVPHGRYINFLSDFMATEQGATHRKAVAAWAEVKALDAPKTYRAWARARAPGGVPLAGADARVVT